MWPRRKGREDSDDDGGEEAATHDKQNPLNREKKESQEQLI